MSYPKIDIIIVNWNAGRILRDCLESIRLSPRDNFELDRVVVVDNASTDGSADSLDDLRLPITLIRNARNRGFAAASNQGARGSRADYLLFLNPDTRLFEESLHASLAFMERSDNQDIGILGIQLLNDFGKVMRHCARFPSPSRLFIKTLKVERFFQNRCILMTDWDHGENREVDQVIGAFFLVRSSLYEALGGFDERFFVYFEEVDFAYRAKKAGWRSFYLAEAQAYHKGCHSSDQVKAERLFYSLRSRILYSYKHFNRGVSTLVLLGILLVEPFSRLAGNLANGSASQVTETIQGYLMLWRAVPGLIRAAWRPGEKS